MKNRANKQGYIKVADSFMLDELLESSTQSKLLLTHITELLRIKSRNDRTNYIAKSEREYLTILYIDVILNGKIFKSVKTPSKKEEIYQHVGMKLFKSMSDFNLFGTEFGR